MLDTDQTHRQEVTELHPKFYSCQSLGAALTLAGCLDEEAGGGGWEGTGGSKGVKVSQHHWEPGGGGCEGGAGQAPEVTWSRRESGSRAVLPCLAATVVLVMTACRTSGPHGNNSQTAAPRGAAPRAAAAGAAAPRAATARILTAAR